MARNKPTLEDAQRIARKRGGRCLSTRYSKSAVKMLWQCGKGHEWEATYNHVQGGKWCPYCRGRYRTIREMRSLAAERGGRCLSKTLSAGMQIFGGHADEDTNGKPFRQVSSAAHGVRFAPGVPLSRLKR